MDRDTAAVREGGSLETDVCIIGAGPAGIVIAADLAARGIRVLVLESGGAGVEPAAQRLSQGRSVGDAYAGLVATRHRQVGGTARVWNTPVAGARGAKYVPLDPADLEPPRVGTVRGGWPLGWDELEGWYRRAQVTCGLGPFQYEGEAWLRDGESLLDLPSDTLTTRVYQLAAAHHLVDRTLQALERSRCAQVRVGATVCRLLPGSRATMLERAEVAAVDGTRFWVEARTFVLAAGAIENARLLLLSPTSAAPDGLGNRSGWVGRCFMEHPRDHVLLLEPARGTLERLGFYDVHPGEDGTTVAGRLALADGRAREPGTPNASLTFVPRPSRPLVSRARLLRARRYPPARPGWSWEGDLAARFDALYLMINVEQQPDVANRIVLARERDRFGVPRVELQWRWRAADQAGLERVRDLFVDALARTGHGAVHLDRRRRLEPNAHHHAGTTRMCADPADGVVDPNGRVHGTENLYVAGASVFPTAGFANPTLTIVALAHRLAAVFAGHS